MNSFSLGSLLLLSLAGLAYFMGWIYMNDYFAVFGISLTNVNPPFQHYFIFAFGSLLSWARHGSIWGWGLILLLPIVVAAVVWQAPNRPLVRTLIGAVAALGVLILGFTTARQQGLADAYAVARGDGGRRVFMVFKPEFESTLVAREDALLQWNTAGDLRLVWQDADFSYVVLAIAEFGQRSPGGDVTVSPTYRIPSEAIEYVQLIDVSRMGR